MLTSRANNPHIRLLRSFPLRPAVRSVIDSASPAVQGSLYDGGCVDASGFFHSNRARRVAPQPDPSLRKPVAHQRCSATPIGSLTLTMTPLTWCLHSIPYAAQCSRFARGVGVVSLGHTLRRCRHPALPCCRFTAHRHRLSQNRRKALPRFCCT